MNQNAVNWSLELPFVPEENDQSLELPFVLEENDQSLVATLTTIDENSTDLILYSTLQKEDWTK